MSRRICAGCRRFMDARSPHCPTCGVIVHRRSLHGVLWSIIVLGIVGICLAPVALIGREIFRGRFSELPSWTTTSDDPEIIAERAELARQDAEREGLLKEREEALERSKKFPIEYECMTIVRPLVPAIEDITRLMYRDGFRYRNTLNDASAAVKKLRDHRFVNHPLSKRFAPALAEVESHCRIAEQKSSEATKYTDQTFPIRTDPVYGPERMRTMIRMSDDTRASWSRADEAAAQFVAAYREAERLYGKPPEDIPATMPTPTASDFEINAASLQRDLESALGQIRDRKYHALARFTWNPTDRSLQIVILTEMWNWAAGMTGETQTVKALKLAQQSPLGWRRITVEVYNLRNETDAFGAVRENQAFTCSGTWGRSIVNRIQWNTFDQGRVWELAERSTRPK